MKSLTSPVLYLMFLAITAHADPILSSWYTQNSGMLARVIQNGTTHTTPLTTWPSAGITNNNTGGTAQTVPAYADVQRIRYTARDVCINASGSDSLQEQTRKLKLVRKKSARARNMA